MDVGASLTLPAEIPPRRRRGGAHLKTSKYPRLRIGIRSPDKRRLGADLADYVLNVMPRDEREVVEGVFARVASAVETWV